MAFRGGNGGVPLQPQLVCCASICCHVCGCIFQEDGIVVRSSEEEWYILIGVEMDIKDVNDFNL